MSYVIAVLLILVLLTVFCIIMGEISKTVGTRKEFTIEEEFHA